MDTKLNFRELQRTNTNEVNEIYSQVEATTRGTLTNTYGISSKPHFGNLKSKYNLTSFQEFAVESLCKELDVISATIDPDKISGLDKNVMNEDGELILYRESSKGLISLTIYDDELVSYSLSGKVSSDDVLTFYEVGTGIDFEDIAYKLLSK